jgi:hypothetical protein
MTGELESDLETQTRIPTGDDRTLAGEIRSERDVPAGHENLRVHPNLSRQVPLRDMIRPVWRNIRSDTTAARTCLRRRQDEAERWALSTSNPPR